MRSAVFGRTGVHVPVIGQGTWNLEQHREEEAIEALEAGIEAGMTHIDTAELYGNGRVESVVRRVIRERRDELFLVSKVLPSNASYDGTLKACERSLQRLGIDHLDVYLLHWRGRHPLEETIRAFEKLVSDGKIKLWGVSNFDVDDLEETAAIAGADRIACNQVLYHLTERSIEHNVMPWCRRHDIAVVAYSPFGSGSFPSARSEGGQVLAAIAKRHAVTRHQVALAFLIREGTFAIPKAANMEHTLDNAAAANLQLSEEEMRDIDTAFPAQRRRHLAMI